MKPAQVLLLLLLATTAVGQEQLRAGQATPAAATVQYHAGEPVGGFPNWAERVLHEWVNRARVDPQADMANCGAGCVEKACYSPVTPLSWNQSLNRAARFHSDEMLQQRYFTHDSRCTVSAGIGNLYPAGCDGTAACACAGGLPACGPNGCTPWSVRVAMFAGSPSGEIIASPGDPSSSFYLWLHEPAVSGNCTFTQQNGHRWLILTATGSFGGGQTGSSVGEFGFGEAPYRIPSGAHYPRQGPSVDLWANWYDTRAPKSAAAIVDGVCIPMILKRGTAVNGAWSTTASGVGSGCHRYYFSFIDASGVEVTYPGSGSLGIGAEGQCADWDTSRLRGSCGTSSSPTSPPPAKKRAARH